MGSEWYTVNGMARTKLKGEMIGIRLPLSVDEEIREEAVKQGLSVTALCSVLLTRAWVAKVEYRQERAAVEGKPTAVQGASNGLTPAERPPTAPAGVSAGACSHLGRSPIAAGLRKCTKCGAVRGTDQIWR